MLGHRRTLCRVLPLMLALTRRCGVVYVSRSIFTNVRQVIHNSPKAKHRALTLRLAVCDFA